MDLFQQTDYRRVVKTLFEAKSEKGYGQVSRLARHLKVNATLVSQVLSGKRHFTEEQAVDTAGFLGLNPKESYYFLLLVQWARADQKNLKAVYEEQLRKLRLEAGRLKGRVSVRSELSFEQQAVYYSSWVYAAIHTLVSIGAFDSRAKISKRLSLPEAQVNEVIERLLEFGLVVDQGGHLSTGKTSTYLAPDSPLIVRHHQSWRQQANQRMTSENVQDFYFTAPFSVAKKDFDGLRKELVEFMSRLYKTVEKSPAEEIVCLNIDFFKL